MANPRQQTVDPNVEQQEGATPEVTTLDGLFAGNATVVDEVVQAPLASDEPPGGWWVVRPNADVEHMTVGSVENGYSFEAGRRYKVPAEVMNILANLDYLLEVPTRYQP